jgi:glycosyltransferase 2 family protein
VISALKALIVVAALVWVGWMVFVAVDDMRSGDLELHIHAHWLAVSGLLVLAAWVLLIRTWLYIVTGLSGKHIPVLTGARIWFISQLSQLLPLRIWGIIQMGAMSVEQGINPVAAGAASIINVAVNLATGMAVAVIAGRPILEARFGDFAWLSWVLTAAALAGILLLPVLVPWAFRIARSRLKVDAPDRPLPARVIFVAAAANVVSWFLMGAALLCLRRGVLDESATSVVQHTTVYTTSYIVGYLALVVPAGIGFREAALTQAMVVMGMASASQANALSVVSRLWLLIIQVLPALIFLAYRRPRADEKTR